MTCREFIDFITDYLEAALPADIQQPFERHLGICPACERYLRQYRVTIAAGRAAFLNGDAALPDDVPEELINAILEGRRRAQS